MITFLVVVMCIIVYIVIGSKLAILYAPKLVKRFSYTELDNDDVVTFSGVNTYHVKEHLWFIRLIWPLYFTQKAIVYYTRVILDKFNSDDEIMIDRIHQPKNNKAELLKDIQAKELELFGEIWTTEKW